jgi:hypothetical protein
MYDPVFVTGSKSFIMKAHGLQAVGFFVNGMNLYAAGQHFL